MNTTHYRFTRRAFLVVLGCAFAIAGVIYAQNLPTAPATAPPSVAPAAPDLTPPPVLPPVAPATAAPPVAPAVPDLTPQPALPPLAPDPAPLPPTAPAANRRNVPTISSVPPTPVTSKPASVQLPTSNPARGSVPTLEDAIVTEETNISPAAAAEKYRAIVATFDAQRPNAAQAVFRLAECLRKAGRFEEAKTQYGRILREFVDHPDLAQLSQKLLTEMPDTSGVRPSPRTPISIAQNEEFFHKDMELVREQLAQTQKLVDIGQATPSTIIPLKRELLRLEQQRADVAAARQAGESGASEVTPDRVGRGLTSKEEDLRAVETELRQQRLELKKLNTLHGLTSTNRPELLTPRLIADNRFQQLKDEYEQRLNATSSPEAGENENKALEASRRKIARWMGEIYVPELDSSIKFGEDQIATLEDEAAKLKKFIAEENKESDLRASRKRDEQLRAGPTPRRQ